MAKNAMTLWETVLKDKTIEIFGQKSNHISIEIYCRIEKNSFIIKSSLYDSKLLLSL